MGKFGVDYSVSLTVTFLTWLQFHNHHMTHMKAYWDLQLYLTNRLTMQIYGEPPVKHFAWVNVIFFYVYLTKNYRGCWWICWFRKWWYSGYSFFHFSPSYGKQTNEEEENKTEWEKMEQKKKRREKIKRTADKWKSLPLVEIILVSEFKQLGESKTKPMIDETMFHSLDCAWGWVFLGADTRHTPSYQNLISTVLTSINRL